MIVDIAIIVIMILAIIIGMKKGLTVCLVNIFSFIIALVVALMLCKPVGNYIMEKTPIGDNIKTTIKQSMPMSDEMKIDENVALPEGIKSYINKQVASVNDTKEATVEAVSKELTKDIVTAIAFIGIFIVVRLALIVVKIISKIITKLPIIKQIDHLGGSICGGVQGIIAIYAIFAVLSVISPIIGDTAIIKQIDNSHIGKAMYNNNIIIKKLYNK